MAYQRRITENGDIRITEVGDTRVTEESTGSQIPASGYVYADLFGRTNIDAQNMLRGKIYIVPSGEWGVYLEGRALIPAFVSTDKPLFSWYNSTDPDNDTITYELELSKDFDWGGAGSIAASGIPQASGSVTSYRITQSLDPDTIYNWRVRAWDGYEYSEWSKTLGVLYSVTTDLINDLYAKVNVLQSGYLELGGKTTVKVLGSSDLGGSVTIPAYSDLFAKVDVPPHSDLGGKIRVTTFRDLGATVNITIPSALSDLPAKVTVVEYLYKNLLARLFVAGRKDLGGSVHVVPYKELPARVRIITALNAKVTIPPKYFEDLGGSVNVTWDHQRLGATVNIGSKGTSYLGATVRIGAINVDTLTGKVNVTWDHQRLGGKIELSSADFSELKARVNVTWDHQRLDGKVSVLVPGTEDLFGIVDVEYNPPPYPVVPSGYVPPSGYPPLPSGWLSGIVAVPPPEAVVVPSGVPQAEEQILFVWEPLTEWGYGATSDGYVVAWNDDPDYVVTLSNQFVPNNYIDKSWPDGGSMYFHIRPKNSHGWLGPQATYNVIINHIPSAVGEPLQVDGLSTPVIGNLAPQFSWQKSTDQDQLDIIKYSIQIATDVGMTNIIREYDKFSVPGAGTTGLFTLPTVDKLPGVGQYYWRVRAHDGWEYGHWSTVHNFSVVRTEVDLGARFTIPTYNFAQVKAKVNILPYSDLLGSIEVVSTQISDLGAKLNVSYKSTSDLGATIRIKTTSDLGAKCFIINYQDLGGRVNVFGVYGYVPLYAKITLSDYDKSDLFAKVNVATKYQADLPAKVLVVSRKELGATVYLYNSTHFGHLFGENFPAKVSITQAGYSDLGGKFLSIADRPGAVVISANVAEATWQENKDIIFNWTTAAPGLTPVESYHIQLDTNPTTEASDSFQINNTFARTYDLELQGGAGIYYFHVAAKNEAGNFGPTTHFAVYYNHLLTDPTTPMTVNNLDTVTAIPIVAATVNLNFEWGQSYDSDDLDVITYRMQIATQEDFRLDINDSSSIVYDESGIPTFFHTITGGGLVSSGEYHWRVMAYDGHQWSGWSPVGHFTVNTPPSAPTNLLVYKA